MRLIKFLLALSISVTVILGGYYFVWNFIANAKFKEITEQLESSKQFTFDYKSKDMYGYPYDINIKFDDLGFTTKESFNDFEYTIGDVIFQIYPFVFEEQAHMTLPNNHFFKMNKDGKKTEFKLQTQGVDIRYVDGAINIELTEVKIFEVLSNQLVLMADKIYYSSLLNDSSQFTFNIKNIKVKGVKVDSILLNMKLKNINKLDLLSIILNGLILEKDDLNAYLVDNLKYIKSNEATLDITNLKVVDDESWFELTMPVTLDVRNRVEGKFDIVSNSLETSQDILHFVTVNDDINLENVQILQRLMLQNNNQLIRLSGKIEKGFLEIFNERIDRTKPFKIK